jgi:hypothetical protein
MSDQTKTDYEQIRIIVREELARNYLKRIQELETELRFILNVGVNHSRILKALQCQYNESVDLFAKS